MIAVDQVLQPDPPRPYEFPNKIASEGRALREWRKIRRAYGRAIFFGHGRSARYLAGRLARLDHHYRSRRRKAGDT